MTVPFSVPESCFYWCQGVLVRLRLSSHRRQQSHGNVSVCICRVWRRRKKEQHHFFYLFFIEIQANVHLPVLSKQNTHTHTNLLYVYRWYIDGWFLTDEDILGRLMVSSCKLVDGCRVWFLMCRPYCTLNRRMFGLRMIGMQFALSASCAFSLQLHASLPRTSLDVHYLCS